MEDKKALPKVLDADGAEIRVGEMVYSTENGDEFTVMAVSAGSGEVHVRWGYDFEDKTGTIAAKLLTHRALVLAADGKPLEEGQTVYVIANGKTHHVTEVDAVFKRFKSMEQVDGSHWLDPMCFTHTKPEFSKRCRDCAHWQKDPTADNMGVCWFFYHEHEGQDCYAARLGECGACEEFVRRAKKLEGVDK